MSKPPQRFTPVNYRGFVITRQKAFSAGRLTSNPWLYKFENPQLPNASGRRQSVAECQGAINMILGKP